MSLPVPIWAYYYLHHKYNIIKSQNERYKYEYEHYVVS